MLNGSKNILTITHSTASLAQVAPTGKIKQELTESWTAETLSELVTSMVSKLKAKKVRLLLGKDVSYVVKFEISKALKSKEMRTVVFDKLQEVVPEDLNNTEWDYRLTGSKDEELYNVVAFAPVLVVYQQITEVINDLQLDVEAVEPEEVAETRNKNPIIGLALKKDVDGKDSSTLTLEIPKSSSKQDSTQDGAVTSSAKKNSPHYVVPISMGVVLGLVVAVLIFFMIS